MSLEPDGEHALRRGRWRPWLPFLLAVLVIAGSLTYGLSIYDSLPDPLPTHWGAGGEPDAWEEKSFGSVFMALFMVAGTVALLAVLAAIMPAMTQAAKDPTDWQRYRQEGTQRGIVAALGWVSLLTALLMGAISYQGWTSPDSLSVFWPTTLYVLSIFAAVILPFRSWERWADRQASAQGVHPSEEERAEDRLWLPGGIYNNPEDDRIMVSKREGYGIGATVNVGPRKGKITVAVFLAVFVLGPILLILGIELSP